MNQNEKDNLEEAKKSVKILNFVNGTKEIGNKMLINPCPKCGKKNHFYVYKATNTFYSYSNCCKGGSIIDYLVQVENMTIPEAIKKLLEIAGFKDNKKSVSEINTLKKKRNNLIFEEEQNYNLFNQLYNNICNLYKQVKSIENRSIYHQFILDFCDKTTTMCLKYNDENLKYLKHIEEEFEMCLNEFFKYYKNLKIVRSDFDV
jgi:hypothetical protein